MSDTTYYSQDEFDAMGDQAFREGCVAGTVVTVLQHLAYVHRDDSPVIQQVIEQLRVQYGDQSCQPQDS